MLGHKIITYRHGALYVIRTETRHTVNRWTYKSDCVSNAGRHHTRLDELCMRVMYTNSRGVMANTSQKRSLPDTGIH
jgi:hypothetical protein